MVHPFGLAGRRACIVAGELLDGRPIGKQPRLEVVLRGMGVEYILLNGGGTSRENLRRFAREVMPHFRTDAPTRIVAAE